MEKRNLDQLTITAANIAGVMLGNRVIGNTLNEKANVNELNDVSRSILQYAETESLSGYLELTYPTCVRLIIKFGIADDNEIFIRDIGAYDHPWPNKEIDYKELTDQLSITITR
jgi:hypothetical protein